MEHWNMAQENLVIHKEEDNKLWMKTAKKRPGESDKEFERRLNREMDAALTIESRKRLNLIMLALSLKNWHCLILGVIKANFIIILIYIK